jgi:DMSO reductase anchor subunit
MTMPQRIKLTESLRNIAGPANKTVWAVPAAINFLLGGTAAGYYILWTLFANPGASRMNDAASGGFLAVALAFAGFASLSLEAGRPLRARFLIANWKRSWMSREAATGMVFLAAAITNALTAWPVAAILAMAAACAFLLSQAMIVFRCTAIPVWRDSLIPLQFISSGIATGYALLLLNRYGLILPQMQITPYADAIALMGLTVNFATWAVMMLRGRIAGMQVMVRRLLQPVKLVVIVGVGQVLPVILLLMFKPWSSEPTGAAFFGVAVIAAPAILIGNCAQKFWFTRYSQYVCGMQLDEEK